MQITLCDENRSYLYFTLISVIREEILPLTCTCKDQTANHMIMLIAAWISDVNLTVQCICNDNNLLQHQTPAS